jgi:hypothetical protein
MKAVLLTVAIVVASINSLFAQSYIPDYNWEAGINAGVSAITRPLGPANAYQGTSTKTVNDFSLRLEYFASPHWMLNLDLGERRWESYGSWTPVDAQGVTLDPRQVSFLIADHAINESVALNYVIPFYTQYTGYNKANLYFGASFGLMQTLNDGSIAYNNYKASPDSNFSYVSRYDYGSGSGFNFGIQMGYTWYIIPRLGVNVDLAMRYAHIKTIDENYGSENNKFYLLYFPETIGIRWRF